MLKESAGLVASLAALSYSTLIMNQIRAYVDEEIKPALDVLKCFDKVGANQMSFVNELQECICLRLLRRRRFRMESRVWIT